LLQIYNNQSTVVFFLDIDLVDSILK